MPALTTIRLGRAAGLLALAALVAQSVSGCSAGGGGSGAPTSTVAVSSRRPDPPWRTEPPIPATGRNAVLLADFQKSKASRIGCRPLGLDTNVWTPGPSFDSTGFGYVMRYGRDLPSKDQRRADGDRSITEWSDGSVTSNSLLRNGTYRFDVEIPVDETGTPGDMCTYVYSPTDPTESGDQIVRALRFIEQPNPSTVNR
jgi:hypothetical protein